MKKAIISDIHGNLEALEAVLTDIDYYGLEDIICLGDVVGYGPNPVECLDLVMKRCSVTICGNHDIAVLNQAFGFNKWAKRAIDWTRRKLKPGFMSRPQTRARWEFLMSRPDRHEEDDGNILYVHGSPRDPVMEYMDENDLMNVGFGPDSKIIEVFNLVKWVSFIGHSHKPGIFTHYPKKDDYAYTHLWDLPDLKLKLGEPGEFKAVVNVGSVGQPRDGDPRSSYVVLDSDEKTVTYRRVFYDVELTRRKIQSIRDLDEKLAARLEAGT
ncbi:MAG: metallophosphoesterase family protein [Planctomycetes bacterium]|nr:metallophosphoesterase family protein [Planctomycetota bacterium]